MATFRIINDTAHPKTKIRDFQVECLDSVPAVGDHFVAYETRHQVHWDILAVEVGIPTALMTCSNALYAPPWDDAYVGQSCKTIPGPRP